MMSNCFGLLCFGVFFLMIRRPPRSTRTDTLFPYATLFRSALVGIQAQQGAALDRGVDRLGPFDVHADVLADLDLQRVEAAFDGIERVGHHLVDGVHADRKSTRLNSSH